jgi:hypothetical protein
MRNRLRLTAITGVAVALTLMAGCKSTTTTSSSNPPPASVPTTAPAASAGSGAPSGAPSAAAGAGSDPGAGPLSSAHMRVANFITMNGQPGPAIDIYDVNLQGQAATPILTNVAYGSVSNYVQLHQVPNAINKEVLFFAMPTGEDPVAKKGDAVEIGGLLDDGSGAQLTDVLTGVDNPLPGAGTSLVGQISDSVHMEKGDDGQGGKGPAAPAVTSGGGELLVDTSPVPTKINLGAYLMIDKSCAPPLNGDPNVKGVPYIFAADGVPPVSSYAVFATPVGTHQVSVVSWSSSTQPACKQLTKLQGTTSVTVAANQQTFVYVYGTSADALHIAIAPIQP